MNTSNLNQDPISTSARVDAIESANAVPEDFQPESGTRDVEDEEIRQSSAVNDRASESPNEAVEEP